MAEGGTRCGPVAKHGARGKVDLRKRDRYGGGMKGSGMVKLGGQVWGEGLTSFRASFFRCEAIARISLEGAST